MILMPRNKKGFAFVWMIALIVGFIVVSIFASYFGLNLLKDTINELGMTTIITALVVVLAVIFYPFTKTVLMIFAGILKSIVAWIRSVL